MHYTRAMAMRWYPGYSVAAVSTLALVCSAPAQTLLVSLLNLPLRNTFGVEPLVLNTSYTLATMAASLPLVWVVKHVDRLGPRKMMMIVATAFGVACLFMASAVHWWMVPLGFFLLRFLGQGSLPTVANHAIAMWFHARLGTIAGVLQVILFGLWVPLPALTLKSIETFGWRATWASFGVIIPVCLCLLAWRFVKNRPEDLGLGLDGQQATTTEEPGHTLKEALRTRAYWILVGTSMLPPMIGTALLFDIQPLLQGRGVSAEAAAGAVGVWSAAMAVMAIPSGNLADRLAPRWPLAAGATALGFSCLLWRDIASFTGAVVAMSICAMGQSLIQTTTGASTARFFGRRNHGAIRSSLTRLHILATGVGPVAFGVSQQLDDSYRPALLLFFGLCAPAAVAALWLAPPPASSRSAA